MTDIGLFIIYFLYYEKLLLVMKERERRVECFEVLIIKSLEELRVIKNRMMYIYELGTIENFNINIRYYLSLFIHIDALSYTIFYVEFKASSIFT